jgi:probable HAF family extracellular repeat protein
MRLKITTGLACTLWLCAASVAQTSYTAIELTIGANRSYGVHRLNLLGQSVGSVGSVDGSGTEAFLSDKAGGVRKLGWLPGGDYSEATAVSPSGTVVGFANSPTSMRAFLWNGSFQDLGTLPGDQSSKALGINARGDVVGYSSGPSGAHAFVWSSKSGMQSILPSASWSEARAISNSGVIIGTSRTAGVEQAFYRDTNGTVVNLGTLSGDTQSAALSISNNAQYVVGRSRNGSITRAFRWNKSTGMQLLLDLALGNSNDSVAYDVNAAGTAVGSSVTAVGAHAALWAADGTPTDLNNNLHGNKNILLTQALAINENGLILAVGGYMNPGSLADLDDEHHAGAVHSFLLIPVP